ncbi:MAG: hypothetical protein F6K21_08335, partial [Symploca sp. SIO2D2]|nr:hypothetical protein [Symploca sp. SIO2D2]
MKKRCPSAPVRQGKARHRYPGIGVFIFLTLQFLGHFAIAQETENPSPIIPPDIQELIEQSRTTIPDFSNPEETPPADQDLSDADWRADTLVFNSSEQGIVVDIEILLWGNEEKTQGFDLNLESQPPFIQNLAFDKTSIKLSPEEWSSELQLSFDIESLDTEAKQSGDIIFTITAEDE